MLKLVRAQVERWDRGRGRFVGGLQARAACGRERRVLICCGAHAVSAGRVLQLLVTIFIQNTILDLSILSYNIHAAATLPHCIPLLSIKLQQVCAACCSATSIRTPRVV